VAVDGPVHGSGNAEFVFVNAFGQGFAHGTGLFFSMCGDAGDSQFFGRARVCKLAEVAGSRGSREHRDGHVSGSVERHGEPALESGASR
jgi:hypothetical protein